ncbi:hypothetical protein SUGI_0821680 [Cryptomeria japonica]|nr:hypothetical protein SUGI_0821680 [Cryptomeria japonica]
MLVSKSSICDCYFIVEINAGLDLDCGPFLGRCIRSVVKAGEVAESLTNTFTTLMRLGWGFGQSLVVIGPNANATNAMIGNYAPIHESDYSGDQTMVNVAQLQEQHLYKKC